MNFKQSVKSLFVTAIVLVGIHCVVSLSQIIANPKPNFQKMVWGVSFLVVSASMITTILAIYNNRKDDDEN